MNTAAYNSRQTHATVKPVLCRLPLASAHNSIAALLPWLSAALGIQHTTTAPPARQRVSPAVAPKPLRQGTMPAELRGTPARTTGFEPHLRGRVLLIADAENLSYGLRKLGYDCDFGQLRQILVSRQPELHAHAFACVRGDDAGKYANEYFRRAGWQAHIGLARTVQTYHGPQIKANSDNQILLACGELITATRPDTLVLATGDGDLGTAIADFFTQRLKQGSVVVCSIAGATSRRLLKNENPRICANVWLGWDCIVPAR